MCISFLIGDNIYLFKEKLILNFNKNFWLYVQELD